MPEELRLGILCGSTLARWQAEALRQALSVDGVRPVVVIGHEEYGTGKPGFRHALWHWYLQKRMNTGALAPVELPAELARTPRITGTDDIATIRRYAPDVLLCFGPCGLPDELAALPAHGAWTLHPGDPERHPGSIPGFWELHRGEAVMGMALLRLGGRNGQDQILRQGWFRTAGRSLPATLDRVLPAASGWVARLCRTLLAGDTRAAEGTPFTTTEKVRSAPGNADMLAFLTSGRRQDPSAAPQEWNIGVLYGPIASLLAERPSLNVRWLPAPGPGQSRQAPAGHVVDGRLNVLYGKLDTVGKGVISRLRPKRDNVLKRSRTLLEGEHGLSRPFVLRHEGQVLVVPESAAGRVDLYRMNAANDALEHVRMLLDEPLCAPTLFAHEGRWWLFGTKAPLEDTALHLYHAPGIEGPWAPHALNPVKMDVRTARPAGTPFVHQGELFRPAADDSAGPGWRVALMRVRELTPTTFREELVRTIGPLKGSAWSHGLGSLSAVDGMTLVDGRRPMPAVSDGGRKKHRQGSGKMHRDRSPDRDQDLEDEDED